jgi:hypothetical protein
MTPTEQDILRASLEKTAEAFWRRRSAKKAKLVLANGKATHAVRDGTGLLAVLSGWVGDLIAEAPEEMQDELFMKFANTVVAVAGIKEEEDDTEPTHEATETLQ